MKKPAVLPDTNYLLRYLLRDIEEQFTVANTFFESVRTGSTAVIIAESVLVECLYILTKYYQVTRADSAVHLAALLQYKGIINRDKEIFLRSLDLFAATRLDPVDCLLAARAAVAGNPVRTFDKELNKICAASSGGK